MSAPNTLCTLDECRQGFGCGHRGPKGQHCYFDNEKALCEVLSLQWEQRFTFDYLTSLVIQRLDAGHHADEAPPEGLVEKFRSVMPSLPKLVGGGGE